MLRRLAGNELGQVLVTLGVAFIIADLCLIVWGGDPIPVPTPEALQQPLEVGGLHVPELPAGRGRHRDRHRDRALPADGAHAARRDDPRGGRRHADGARGRHPGVEAVHDGVLSRRRTRRRGRHHRRPHHVRLPRSRLRHAAARADRRDPRRRRQPRRRVRRQLHHRLHLHVRHRAVPRSRLRDPVSADDRRDRVPPARFVRGRRREPRERGWRGSCWPSLLCSATRGSPASSTSISRARSSSR